MCPAAVRRPEQRGGHQRSRSVPHERLARGDHFVMQSRAPLALSALRCSVPPCCANQRLAHADHKALQVQPDSQLHPRQRQAGGARSPARLRCGGVTWILSPFSSDVLSLFVGSQLQSQRHDLRSSMVLTAPPPPACSLANAPTACRRARCTSSCRSTRAAATEGRREDEGRAVPAVGARVPLRSSRLPFRAAVILVLAPSGLGC